MFVSVGTPLFGHVFRELGCLYRNKQRWSTSNERECSSSSAPAQECDDKLDDAPLGEDDLRQSRGSADDFIQLRGAPATKIERTIHHSLSMHANATESRVQKKLSRLYGGKMLIPKSTDGFINLSDYPLSDHQKELLNLGLKCNYMPHLKKKVEKTAELELLYRNLCGLQRKGKIDMNPVIKELSQAESTKHRAHGLESLLQDPSKFVRVKKNPIEEIQKKVALLINNANASRDGVQFSPLQGHYEPGYFCGNVKTHKPGHKLRPIISQIPTPTYQLQLNDLITQYIPTIHALRSTDEFVDLLRNTNPQGILVFLDVQSLFTNVPVEDTIKIILQNVFNQDSLPPPMIPRLTLENMLRTCTKEVRFRCPSGKIYFQTDGVAMDSPLGVLFVQADICHIENHALDTLSQKPNLRYIDNIFVDIEGKEQLECLKNKMEEISCPSFTVERSVDDKIPFLDVWVYGSEGAFITSVYRQPSNSERCLNGSSECPSKYKISVIRTCVTRTFKFSSNWILLHQELNRV
ncbi:uncharacterized protein LOC143036162 [Oratosquilla oratoria]|uniref:uncharacterized protein LOC143036162 n=1 Tax=Oratosquilla oratoria TaxID=337810 RepID=UPI003F76A0E3